MGVKNKNGLTITCDDLLNAMQDAVFVLNAEDGTIAEANNKAYELCGWEPLDLIGRHFTVLSPEEFITQAQMKFNTIVEAGKAGSFFEVSLQHKDGRIIPAELNPGILLDKNGKPAFVLGSVRDITEKKEIQRQLKENELRYKSVYNQIRSAMLILQAEADGHDFIVKSINHSCEKHENVKNGDVCERKLSEVFPGYFQCSIINNLWNVQTNKKAEFVADIHFPDNNNGSWRDYFIYPLPSGELAVYFDDVNERKYIERAMHQAYNIVNHMQFGLLVFKAVNIHDDHSLTLIFANPTSEILLKFPIKELAGKTYNELFPTHPEKGISEKLIEVIRSKQAIRYDDDFYDSESETYRTFAYKAFPLPENQIGISFEDITLSRQAEESLKEHDEIIRNLYEGVTQEVGSRFFESLVLNISRTLKADYTMVGELHDNKIITRSVCLHGRITDNFEYEIAGTPCEKVLKENICYFPKETYKLFPDDKMLTDLKIEGYIGVPLKDMNREISGILVALFKKPIKDVHYAESVLKIFSTRVGNELERQQSENKIENINRELSASKAYLDSIFKAAPVGIGVVVNRVFQFVNEKILEMTGYSRDELIGKNARMIYPHDEEYERVGKEKYRQIDEYGVGSVETKWVRSDGTFIDVLLSSCPIDKTDYSKGVTFTALDITQRKQAEANLKHERDYINRLTETSPVGIVAINPQGEIVFANQQAEITLGITKEDMTGRKYNAPTWRISGFDGSPFPNEQLPFFRVMNEKNSVYNIRHAIEYPNGKRIFLSVNASPVFNENGAIEEVVATIEDISRQIEFENQIIEQEKALRQQNEQFLAINEELTESNNRIKIINEELIRAKEKAEESDRLKSAFLANMSHEIRTPMNGILGFVSLLSRTSVDDDKRQEYVQIIKSCTDNLLQIVNDILDISKIEAGIIEIEESEFSVNQMIDNVLMVAEEKNRSLRNETLKISCHKALPDEEDIILSDEKRITQIFNNLIDNALKFTNKGFIDFGYKVYEDQLQFYVKDTGIGIPEDKFEIIFQRFTQADQSLTREFGGTGLGLAICKSYVEMLGGKIWLESELQKGSTFYFSVPLKRIKATNMKSVISEEEKQWSSKKILIVEDDRISRDFLLELLSETGIYIDTAGSASEAMKKISENNYDLILLDI